MLEPANENLHISSHHDIEEEEEEEEEVMVLEDMQTMRDVQEEKEEGGTRGEDWEEVRIQPFYSNTHSFCFKREDGREVRCFFVT